MFLVVMSDEIYIEVTMPFDYKKHLGSYQLPVLEIKNWKCLNLI